MTMSTRRPEIVITGYGQMGHAMESLLQDRAKLHIWPIAPAKLALPEELQRPIAEAELVLLCVPTVAHVAALNGLASLSSPQAAVLSIAKGLDDDGRTAADILAARFDGRRPWGTLGGPMVANEIIAGRPAFAELGSRDPDLLRRLGKLLTPRLRLKPALSPHAVSWCGVLKNVYAPLVGISDELVWGDNARGHLAAACLEEMRGVQRRLFGSEIEVYGDAGLADFVTTFTSPHSHHYALGQRVARGDLGSMECEGVHTLTVLRRQETTWLTEFPLLHIASDLGVDPRNVVTRLREWLVGG